MRFRKGQPRTDTLKGNKNPLLALRVSVGFTQDEAVALYRKRIGGVSRRTWQMWEDKSRKREDIPPGAFLIFKV